MISIAVREYFAVLGILLLPWLSVQAVEPQQRGTGQASDEELVKQTQNPVADLISVPLQNNFNFGTGSKNRTVCAGNLSAGDPDSYY